MKAKIIRINAKCSDMFSADVVDETGKILKEYNGYVPDFFPGQHYGDYIELDIELETGRILNWKKTTRADIDSL